ncbi:FAST kinase domain-containing protein 5, mitochondrial [Genypterus blacodes]|uniref:FAST kinase domain-containing protein 5, mitochondrial n=1 Tax=Genypterus blacodes TaxID=154954 RepID=UPI003F777F9A
MAARVLHRRVPRLCFLPGLRPDVTVAQQLHDQAEVVFDKQEKKEKKRSHEASPHRGYKLCYNPSAYQRSVRKMAPARSQRDTDEDDLCLSTLAPPFWQQSGVSSSHYTVSCSRHLSSTNNTLLDLAFNKAPRPKMPSRPRHQREPLPAELRFDNRAFLKSRPEYASTSLDLTRRPREPRWEEVSLLLHNVTVLKSSMTPSDVTRFLVELSHLHPGKMLAVRSDHRFLMLLRYSVENLRHFTDLQLLEVLRAFVWLELPKDSTVLEQYEAELSQRIGGMTLPQMLLAADLWRCIGKRAPKFLLGLYDSVSLHLGQIETHELVQLLYIIGEGRHCPTKLIMPLEKLLMRHLPKLVPEEVGTVSLALFKSSTSMSESAVTRIVDKAVSYVEEMSDVAIVNVFKLMRFSYLAHIAWIQAMEREVPRRAPDMGVAGLMHVTLACSALHFRNERILSAVAERVPSLLPHCRNKDTGKLLWAFGMMRFLPMQSPSFYPSLTDNLRQKKAEFKRNPEHFLTGLLGLAFVSQFPEDLLALALSPESVNIAMEFKKMDLKKDLFTLDGAVALELPDWTGPRLEACLREEMADTLWKLAQSDVCLKPAVLEAERALQDLLGGEEFVRKRMILPHTRSIDLEVHIDSSGKPVPVASAASGSVTAPLKNSLPTSPPHQGWDRGNLGVSITDNLLAQLTNHKRTSPPSSPSPTLPVPTPLHTVEPEESGKLFTRVNLTDIIPRQSSVGDAAVKLAIQVSNRNHYCYHSQQLLGLYAMKRRHLKLAGYTVVELGHHEWFPLLKKSKAERLAYLRCQVYDVLN